MCFNLCGIKIEIKFLFIAAMVLLMLLDTSGVMLCAFLSSAVHELAHLTALLALKGEVTTVSFEAFGIRITRVDALLVWEELVVLLAGPLANLLLFLLCVSSNLQSVSLISAVNLWIGVFNLLPVGALDGGRVASLILVKILGEQKGGRAAIVLSVLIILPLFVFGLILFLRPTHNFSLLIVCVFLALTLLMGQRANNTKVML